MTYVIIRRCPVCPTINAYAEQLMLAFKRDRRVLAMRIDGSYDEFSVIVDGEPIDAMDGDALRPVHELTADIRERLADPVAV